MITKRVLIVDDDIGIREILELTLKAMTPWEVFIASSGKEAIAIAQKEDLDVILMDMMMPEIDGIETLKRIQANNNNKSIPSILFTAKSLGKKKQELANFNCLGIINKPFKCSDLVNQMRSLLNWTD
jgi:CheY-like chemotaxis protein